jgi:hypothetical protein
VIVDSQLNKNDSNELIFTLSPEHLLMSLISAPRHRTLQSSCANSEMTESLEYRRFTRFDSCLESRTGYFAMPTVRDYPRDRQGFPNDAFLSIFAAENTVFSDRPLRQVLSHSEFPWLASRSWLSLLLGHDACSTFNPPRGTSAVRKLGRQQPLTCTLPPPLS